MRAFLIFLISLLLQPTDAHAQKTQVAKRVFGWALKTFGAAESVAPKVPPKMSSTVMEGLAAKSAGATNAADDVAKAASASHAGAEAVQTSEERSASQEIVEEGTKQALDYGYDNWKKSPDTEKREKEKSKFNHGRTEYYGR